MRTKKKFTEEEILTLRQNPHTLSVTENRLSFTLEAKKKILESYGTGKSMRQVLRELGYEPEVLGDARIKSIRHNLQDEAKSETGIHQGYARPINRKRLSPEEIEKLGADAASVIRLKNEVVYLRAEVEFLKKISQQVISGKRGK